MPCRETLARALPHLLLDFRVAWRNHTDAEKRAPEEPRDSIKGFVQGRAGRARLLNKSDNSCRNRKDKRNT